jgi:hypothetical protein
MSKTYKNILLEDYQEIDTRTNGQKFKDGAWTALGAIFFPITAVKYLISGVAMEIILPAGGYFGNQSILKDYENGKKSKDLTILKKEGAKYNKITTASGYKTGKVTLINEKNEETDISKRKCMIYFMGNGYSVIDGIGEALEMQKNNIMNYYDLNVHTSSVIYDNLSKRIGQNLKKHDIMVMEHVSGGWNVKPSIECGIALVQNALDAGYRPENIDVLGHSLGGGISAQVLNHFKDKGITFGEYINTCSFSKTSDFVGKNKIVSVVASGLGVQLDTESVINDLPVKHTTIIKTRSDDVMEGVHLHDVVEKSYKISLVQSITTNYHQFPINDVTNINVDQNRAENKNYVNGFKNQVSLKKVVTPFFTGLSVLSAIPATLVVISVNAPQIWENISKSVFEVFNKIAQTSGLKATITFIGSVFSVIATGASLYMMNRNVESYDEKKDQIKDMKDKGFNIDDKKIEKSGIMTKLFFDIIKDTQEKTTERS